MIPRFLIAAILITMVGCATTDEPGWQGSAATPFDTARRHCEAEAVRRMTDLTTEAAFKACMAQQGWRQP